MKIGSLYSVQYKLFFFSIDNLTNYQSKNVSPSQEKTDRKESHQYP